MALRAGWNDYPPPSAAGRPGVCVGRLLLLLCRAAVVRPACLAVSEACRHWDVGGAASLEKACVAQGCEPRLDRVFETWGKWREAEDDAIGFAVQKVVRELEADHLRPLSIVKRLESGVTLACFGALTLMDQLSLHAPPSSDI